MSSETKTDNFERPSNVIIAVNVTTRSLERDLEKLKTDHATEIEQLNEKQKQELRDLKKKQWCYNCEAEAIYWLVLLEHGLLFHSMPATTLGPGA